MPSFASLLATLMLALMVSANPIVVRDNLIRVPFAKRVNGDARHLLAKDQARAAALKLRGSARSSGTLVKDAAAASIQVTNQAVDYVANVGVGTPATTYSLLIDTGSSNTWVGAGKKFVKTSTSVQTSNKVAVTYGSGSFSGTEFTDTVTVGTGLVITGQSFGVASKSTGFSGVDGIIGIGPTILTEDTLSPATTTLIPTVTDNLFSQGTIPEDLVAVSFEPTTSDSVTNGELTFGGTDSSKFTGSIAFTPLTTTSPANEFWGINESITYGTTVIQSTTAGIVDTGTTLVLIATGAFSAYEKATKSTLDETTGLLKLSTSAFANVQSLTFTTSGGSFVLTANAQAWPRALNTAIGGTTGNVYLIVNSLGTPAGEGLDFINGQTFLERFYAVFDTTNKRVGFATTSFTDATTN